MHSVTRGKSQTGERQQFDIFIIFELIAGAPVSLTCSNIIIAGALHAFNLMNIDCLNYGHTLAVRSLSTVK